jgi:hypothetical protein
MKNILIAFLLILFVSSSCNDDFLERIPLDSITSETFWNTESNLTVYNNSFYNLARNDQNVPIMMGHDEGFNSNFLSIWYLDEMSDNATSVHPRHNFYVQIRAGKHIATVSPDNYRYRGWNFVRALNIGLANYGKAKIADAIRNRYIGEARLFRGWFYADKVSKYGDVPYIEKELNTESEELFAARMPRVQAMKQWIKFLTI